MTWRIAALLLTTGLWACSGDDTTSGDDDGTTEPEETADTGGGPQDEDYTGKEGNIALVSLAPDVFYGQQQYLAFGVFPDDDQGILNLSWCVAGGEPCITAFPASGEILDGADSGFLFTDPTYDVGDLVVDGAHLNPNPQVSYFDWYNGSPGGWGETGTFSLDGDYAPYEGADTFTYATELVMITPDPEEPILAHADDVISFTWEPGTSGTVLLEFGDTVMTLDDDGAYDLPVAELDLDNTLDVQTVTLARTTDTTIDAAGNTVHVFTTSQQRYQLSYLDTTDRTELVIGDDVAEECSDADELPPLQPGDYWGDLTDAADDHNLDLYNDLTYFNTPGNDVVGRIDLLDGQDLTVHYATYFDASMYLLDADCDENDGLIGADDEYYLDTEDFKYTADQDESVYLVLDSYFEGGWYYWLEIEIEDP